MLETFELAVLRHALAGSHPTLAILREQLNRVEVVAREHTGVGIYVSLRVPADCRRIAAPRLVIHDLLASIEGVSHGAGFMLFVTDGALDLLEGFTYEEQWPTSVGRFELRYSEPTRHALLAELDRLAPSPNGSGSHAS